MTRERVGWCIAIKVGGRFEVIPRTGRTNRHDAIDHYMDIEDYNEEKRSGHMKTVPIYAEKHDLR